MLTGSSAISLLPSRTVRAKFEDPGCEAVMRPCSAGRLITLSPEPDSVTASKFGNAETK